MVKLKCIYAVAVATPTTTAALMLYGHQPNFPTTLSNRVDQVGSAICIAPLLHQTSLPLSQPPALPAELPGNLSRVRCCVNERHDILP